MATLRSDARTGSCIVSGFATESAPMFSMALFARERAAIPSIAELCPSRCEPTVGGLFEHEKRRSGSGTGGGPMPFLAADDTEC